MRTIQNTKTLYEQSAAMKNYEVPWQGKKTYLGRTLDLCTEINVPFLVHLNHAVGK